MLLEFSLENFRSFGERQTFSLIAGAAAKKHPHVSFPTGNRLAPFALTTACIFGANGSGKTNLVRAMHMFSRIISSSTDRNEDSFKKLYQPFKLCKEARKSPTEFEAIFICEENLYQYGFSYNDKRVLSEWLFVKPNKKGSTLKQLFARDYDPDSGEYSWEYPSAGLKGHKSVWQDSTKDTSLFLTTAAMLNSDVLNIPYKWSASLRVIYSNEQFASDQYSAKRSKNEEDKAKILGLLRAADGKIKDIVVEETDHDFSEMYDMFARDVREQIRKHIEKETALIPKFTRTSQDGEDINFELADESSGTQTIFCLAGPWLNVLENGTTLVVDELHNSLHPNALRYLVNMFVDPNINTKGAQLIFTSHETSILTKNFLHRDQIWLTEKDDCESSEIFPLSDFEERSSSNLQKAYLDGRYGAVPKLGSLGYGTK